MTTNFIFPRPAGMGFQCDEFVCNPAHEPDNPDCLEAKLMRCSGRATHRMVIQNGGHPRSVKRCEDHASAVRRDASYKILSVSVIRHV